MAKGIIYLNVGEKHLRNLAVSIWSLRQEYEGPIAVLTGDDRVETFFDMNDKRLGDFQLVPFEYDSKRNGCYAAKTSMHKLTPFESTVYLDADTVIHGPLDELFPTTPESVVWTQFAHWTTQSKRIRNRIQNEGWPKIFPAQVAYQLAGNYPAINTGVLGFDRTSHKVMDEWNKKTLQNVSFICDEICAQLLAFEYPHNVLDHRFNASPRFSYNALGLDDLSTSDVRVIHSHGNKGLKCSPKQQVLFLEAYFAAYADDFAGLQSWDHKTWRGKKHPSKYVERFSAKWRSWAKQSGATCEPPKNLNK